MNYKVQLEVSENDLVFTVPSEEGAEFFDGSQILRPNNLTQEQQEHLGSLMFLISSGVINSQLQTCLSQSNMQGAVSSWEQHESERDVNTFLNEDVVSPHEIMSSNPEYRSYSSPVDKPDTIKLKYKPINLKDKAVVDAYDGEESGQFFGFEKLYELNTNFRLTKEIVNVFIPIDGVEVTQPLSRYKMLVGFGELFDDEEIKFEIHKAVDTYFESL